MADQTITELALAFGRSMSEMRNAIRQHIQVKLKEHNIDITFELLEVMALLWRKDGINQQELADIAIKDKSSMTYLIDNLVKRNLVKRVEDEIDRRSKRIFLTQDGKLLQKKIHPWIIKTYENATAEVDASEIEKALNLVKKMNKHLKK